MSGKFKAIEKSAAESVDRITYSPRFSALCSIGRSPFFGVIEIEYCPGSFLLEFESFEIWLRSISNETTTIEGMARRVFNELTIALGGVALRVTVRAETVVHAPASATVERKGKEE